MLCRPNTCILFISVALPLASACESRPEKKNLAPEAVIADVEEATYLSDIMLDSTDSSDRDGDTLVNTWTLVPPLDSIAQIDDPTAETTEFNVDMVIGTYLVLLTVSDGVLADTTESELVVEHNPAPIVEPGENQVSTLGDMIELDGSASFDVDDEEISLEWALIEAPEMSSLSSDDLYNCGDGTASLEPDTTGTYEFRLLVSDGVSEIADHIRVEVYEDGADIPPLAQAQPLNHTIKLDQIGKATGEDSWDEDSDHLDFSWTFASVPEGSALTDADIGYADAKQANFEPDVTGAYRLNLSVSDGTTTTRDSCVISVREPNTAPTAEAGGDNSIVLDETDTVTVDGSASTDADGDGLETQWTLIPPPGSVATLDDDTAKAPTFEPDVVGAYTLILTVNDGVDQDTDVAVWNLTSVPADPDMQAMQSRLASALDNAE